MPLNIPQILSKKIVDKYSIINNAFIGRDKGKVNEEREIEIGDIHSENFQPQIKLLQWDFTTAS